MKVDLLLYNGTILTIDDNNTVVNWIAAKDGKIIDLGCGSGYNQYLKTTCEAVDLMGKTVLPGFYDSHVNLVQTGLNLLSLNLSDVRCMDELFSLIRHKASQIPEGETIRGIGFDELKLIEKKMPTRYELDRCAPNNPVWISRVDYHTSIVNSLALHMLNLPFNLEGIVRDGRSLPNGQLTGRASALVRSHMLDRTPEAEISKGVHKALDIAIEKGITSINAVEGGFTFHDKHAEFMLENKNSFPIDITLFYQTVDIEKIISKGLKRIGGTIFLDGTFGSRTAALAKPYSDDSSKSGTLYFNQEELNSFILDAHMNDLQIAVHAIGSRAIEQALTAYEYAQFIYPRKDPRHRIEHFELPLDEHIQRAKSLGIVASVQPTYEYLWGGTGKMYETRLGEARRKHTNPFNKYIKAGLIVAGGSDSDLTPMNPLLGIYSAVNHPNDEYSISIHDAIKLFTINGAKAVFEEETKGSIEKGKFADMVIIDINPLEIAPSKINEISVVATIKEGNILFIK
ncbi:MAG: amidohydrolase [Clostridiaceae bacterium]|nr:amidohydrolase [Clostridiaceae bacterium]